MQYVDYIAQYNARRERAEQLAKRYNQKPASQRVQNLWMVSVEKQSPHRDMQPKELWGIIASLAIVALILILSIR